jgi:exonuclease III
VTTSQQNRMSETETKSLSSGCRLLTWNVNGAQNTFANIRLRHGSLRGFADSLCLDLICLQVSVGSFEERESIEEEAINTAWIGSKVEG